MRGTYPRGVLPRGGEILGPESAGDGVGVRE